MVFQMKSWVEHKKDMAIEERNEWILVSVYSVIVFAIVMITI
jgi:hypothetical protein